MKYEKSIISPLEKANETFGTAFKIHVIKSAQNITEPHAFGLLAGGAKNFQYLPPPNLFCAACTFSLFYPIFCAKSNFLCFFSQKSENFNDFPEFKAGIFTSFGKTQADPMGGRSAKNSFLHFA
ncbi:MAG: hypothetical protein IJD43_12815 [Thermoguttaceae bacterium]|nr:hypothetical protein [Thermoguttaceae bacterium]